MAQKTGEMHGRDHVADGRDPIPGLIRTTTGTYTDFVLGQPTVWEYWPLNDASGNPVGLVGGRAMTVHGGTFTYQQGGPFSDQPLLTSLATNGVSNWLSYTLTTPEAAVWVGTLPWTWMGWVYATGSNDAMFSFHNLAAGGGASSSAAYTFSPDVLRFQHDSTDVSSGVALSASVWHHVAMTYAGSGTGAGILYLDGVQIATLTNTATSQVNQMRIGAQGNVGSESNFWTGRQAQVAFFTSVLSAADIADAASRTTGAAQDGMVPVSDGAGGYDWAFPLEVTF
jgi:hypothetical protein